MSRDYLQPSFYRFNEDSLNLVKYIEELDLKEKLNFLDIGSGCGVIGIELARLKPAWSGTLLEPQKEFQKYLHLNTAQFKTNRLKIVQSEIESAVFEEYFDLIVFNPPYFFENETRGSGNKQRRKCRQINKDDFNKWFDISAQLLKREGKIVFCFRSNESWFNSFSHNNLSLLDSQVRGTIDYRCLEKFD